MNYKLNVDDKFKAQLELSIDKNEFNKVYSDVLNHYKKNVKIDGFRPGKAPISIIKTKFDKEIEEEAINKLLPEKLEQIFTKEEIIPLHRPILKKIDKKDNEMLFEIEFDIYPQVEIKDYEKIEINVKKEEVDDKIINEEIEKLRNNFAETKEKQQAIDKGDIAIIDLSVFDKNGVELENLRVKDYSVEIGSERIFKEINDALINHKKGEQVEQEYKYPDDFEDETLKGKEVLFKMNIKNTYEKILPEVNDEFAKKFNLNNVEQLKTAIKSNIENKNKNEYNAKIDEEIINSIIEKNQFNAPETLINAHLMSIVRTFTGKEDIEINDEIKKIYRPYAEWRAKRELILGALIKQEKLKVDEKEVTDEIEKLKKSSNEEWRKYAEREETKKDIEMDLLYKKAMNFLKEHTYINGEPLIKDKDNNKGGE